MDFTTPESEGQDNYSSITTDDQYLHQIEEPFPAIVLRLVLFAILFLTALIGNSCVFTAPLRNTRLRTFSYCLITCLALSDFISTLGLPFTLATEQLGSNWIFGRFLCHALNPTQVVCGMVTTNVHTAIAVDRYISVVYPFKGKPKGFRMWLIVALIWLTAVLCSLPAFGVRKLEIYPLEGDGNINLCVEVFPADLYRHLYSLFLFLVNYFIPIVSMIILYIKVILHLQKAGRYRCQRRGSLPLEGGIQTVVERKFIRMAFLIMILFVLCYLPYQIVFLLMDFEFAIGLSYGFILFDYAYLVTWLPNALNPICYGAMDRYYAKAYKKIFHCYFSKRAAEHQLSNTGLTLIRVRQPSRDIYQSTLVRNHETDC